MNAITPNPVLKQYEQRVTVKAVEERKRTICVSGFGADAKTEQISDGWYITFTDSKTAVVCETKPDVEPGDIATCTWTFAKPSPTK